MAVPAWIRFVRSEMHATDARTVALLWVGALVAVVHLTVWGRPVDEASFAAELANLANLGLILAILLTFLVATGWFWARMMDESDGSRRVALFLLGSGGLFAAALSKLGQQSDLTAFYEMEAAAGLALLLAFSLENHGAA